jgi:hypothetical protein
MKKLIFFFSLLSVVLVTSCSIGSGDSDYSPQMNINSVSLNGVTVSKVDTLKVGDVLLISGTASGVSKPLVSVQVTNDSNYSTISFPDISSLGTNVLNNGKTDVSNGYFYFSGLNIYSFTFNVQYVATKATSGSKLVFVVSSTSQYSPLTYTVSIPAK